MVKKQNISKIVKDLALANGADLAGVVSVSDLPEDADNITRMLPSTRSVLVVAAKHSLASVSSAVNNLAQFDTIHTYGQCARATHTVSRFLESEGFSSAAVPAFIPLDMTPPRRGMKGEICWRRAGVRAGLGSYGENGLLVTEKFGSAVRIAGVITAANLKPDQPLSEDMCDHCMRCIKACPAGALLAKGKINKKLCGDIIFKYGFRFFQQFMTSLIEKPRHEVLEMLGSYELLELWQTFMTGNYYYCFECQSKCPTADLPRRRRKDIKKNKD
jgi:epoxyqueuosine reductase QueG